MESALTHPSYWGEASMSDEERLAAGYERLEFLGDSVIGLTVCSYLFKVFPAYDQGQLSKIKSYLVSKQVLAKVARSIGLQDYIRMGKGMDGQPAGIMDSFLADCMESLVGAHYVDRGFPATQKFILRVMGRELTDVRAPEDVEDAKTLLQELVQHQRKEVPRYRTVAETGPDHRKRFVMKVMVGGREWGQGTGYSKKEAERSAALAALQNIENRKKADKKKKSKPAV